MAATFLLLKDAEINTTVDEQERIMLTLAAGQVNRHEFTEWLREHVRAAADGEGDL